MAYRDEELSAADIEKDIMAQIAAQYAANGGGPNGSYGDPWAPSGGFPAPPMPNGKMPQYRSQGSGYVSDGTIRDYVGMSTPDRDRFSTDAFMQLDPQMKALFASILGQAENDPMRAYSLIDAPEYRARIINMALQGMGLDQRNGPDSFDPSKLKGADLGANAAPAGGGYQAGIGQEPDGKVDEGFVWTNEDAIASILGQRNRDADKSFAGNLKQNYEDAKLIADLYDPDNASDGRHYGNDVEASGRLRHFQAEAERLKGYADNPDSAPKEWRGQGSTSDYRDQLTVGTGFTDPLTGKEFKKNTTYEEMLRENLGERTDALDNAFNNSAPSMARNTQDIMGQAAVFGGMPFPSEGGGGSDFSASGPGFGPSGGGPTRYDAFGEVIGGEPEGSWDMSDTSNRAEWKKEYIRKMNADAAITKRGKTAKRYDSTQRTSRNAKAQKSEAMRWAAYYADEVRRRQEYAGTGGNWASYKPGRTPSGR